MAEEVPGYAELEFDLPAALLRDLVKTLGQVAKVPLLTEHTMILPEEQGVYQLFLDDEPVYVGKTDSESGLMSRLTRHSRKVLHRKNLDPARVSFKAIRIYVFTAVKLEGDLIRHYGGVSGLAWNGSGFGSNDPGRERDTTKNKATNFDYQYPADIDRDVDLSLPARCSAAAALNIIGASVPYTLRMQKPGGGRKLHRDLEETMVVCPSGPTSFRAAIAAVVRQLPMGWQATKLLGYVILYKETKVYPDQEIIART